jgi:large subunit ribosomal protein L18
MTVCRISSKEKRQQRTRFKIRSNNKDGRLRLSVHRSNNHFAVQLINDNEGVTVVSASTKDKEVRDVLAKSKSDAKAKTNNVAAAIVVAQVLSERAKKHGVIKVVFDKGPYAYHGKVKAFATACREAQVFEF